MYSQPRETKARVGYRTYLNPELQSAIDNDCIRWKCSESWIVATALAAFYGVDIIRPSDVKTKKTRKRNKRK